MNYIALNNAANYLRSRREYDHAVENYLKAISQPGVASPIAWGNAVGTAVGLGRWGTADSVQRAWVRRMPNNPDALLWPPTISAIRGDLDGAEATLKALQPRVANSRTGTETVLGRLANLAAARGRLREAARLRADLREREAQRGSNTARLQAGLDSVMTAAVVLDDRAGARAMLARALARAPLDSIPYRERTYDAYLATAALAADTARAREWYAAARKAWIDYGATIDRPAWESLNEATFAFAEGRLNDALAAVNEADRRLLSRIDIIAIWRFLIQDRLQHADSTIAAGESYLAVTAPPRLVQDANFLAGFRQRLGELYEAKGNTEKALEHYQAFVELWKNADPELQPRVRDVRGRIDRLRAMLAKKG
jgi:tetratricopeptide (TPR) repeat protein